MPLTKPILVDFHDSFTFNIASELKLLGCSIEVVDYIKWKKYFKDFKKASLTILGPGPGHPSSYKLQHYLGELLNARDGFVAGICLGHQFIGEYLGYSIEKSINPIHGQTEFLSVPVQWQEILNLKNNVIHVQRYNSLAVREREKVDHCVLVWKKNQEIMAFSGSNFISYQFHPESLGTNFRSSFFTPLRPFFL
jgi:anthranilate/para-aminobenzoate synthase component II